MLEIEIKLPISDIEAVRARLIELGFEPKCNLRTRDVYFDNANGQIKGNGQALRVREVIDRNSGEEYSEVNFKDRKMDSRTVSRRELETGVSSAETMIEIFSSMGFMPVKPWVCKIRDEYSLGEINACVDVIEGLGDFLELEIVASEQVGVPDSTIKDEAVAKIELILAELGYSMEDAVTTSYLGMLQGVNY